MEFDGTVDVKRKEAVRKISLNGTTAKNGIQNGASPPRFIASSHKPTPEEYLEAIEESTAYLLSRTKHRPRTAIICGTGLGSLGQLLEDVVEFPYRTIPNFTDTTVKGHAGRLLFGTLNGKCVVCMQGRLHAYEGHSMLQMTFPIRVFHAFGVRVLLVTNAGGSLRSDFRTGDVVVMKDHINLPGLAGLNPLVGLYDERLGPRFPAMNNAYDATLRQLAKQTADELGLSFVREGVYFCQTGPCFETIAECRMARCVGADVAGMSTCPEVIVALHGQQPMRCVGLSLITNMCPMDYDTHESPTHDEVLEIGEMRSDDLKRFVWHLIGKIDDSK